VVNPPQAGRHVVVNVELQEDFSMDQALSLYLVDTLPLLDRESPTYALDLLSLVEAILENPEIILRKQLDKLKGRKIAEWKQEGMEYDERMEELEKLEHPKPLREFTYATFNAFAERHPWVGQENIRPKSIVREMFERFRTFVDYVKDYELQRSEGVLLRHLTAVHKVLAKTVPDSAKTPPVRELEEYLKTVLRVVDSSLLDEWERLRNPGAVPTERAQPEMPGQPAGIAPVDITGDEEAFLSVIRARILSFLAAWNERDWETARSVLVMDVAEGSMDLKNTWSDECLEKGRSAYDADHERLSLEPEARNRRHTHVVKESEQGRWQIQQMLIDPEEKNDWVAEFQVDLERSRTVGEPCIVLLKLGNLMEEM
jgi:hypothetical protein